MHEKDRNGKSDFKFVALSLIFKFLFRVDGLRYIVESHAQPMTLPPRENLAAYNALIAVRHQLQQTELCNSELSKMIENAPAPLNHNDPDLLLLKVILKTLRYEIFL